MAIDPQSNTALEVSDEAEYMNKLRNAPITELADYIGIDIDLAVQLRVDKAVEDTYDKIAARRGVIAQDIYNKWAAELGQDGQPPMEVTARPIEPQGNLYGFASVKIGGIKIEDFKILADKDKKLFVGMPSKPDKTSNTGYRNTVFVDKDFKDDFNKTVLSAHYDAVGVLMERADKMRSTPDAPERMADQVAKAKQEADKHNAALPPKEKGAKARSVRGD
jgi:DNA-binding cell septation regulator SpoVG